MDEPELLPPPFDLLELELLPELFPLPDDCGLDAGLLPPVLGLGLTACWGLLLDPFDLSGLICGLWVGLDRLGVSFLGLTVLPSREPELPPFQIREPLERGSTGRTRGLS